jgi:hypothetical protein
MYSLVDDLEKLFKRHYTHQPEAAILAPADNMAVTETELVPVA